jgi:hypothetical protein
MLEAFDVWLVCDDVYAIQQNTHCTIFYATQGTIVLIPARVTQRLQQIHDGSV